MVNSDQPFELLDPNYSAGLFIAERCVCIFKLCWSLSYRFGSAQTA